MMKEATGIIPPIPENIPQRLAERPQWVCWRLEEHNSDLTKVPYTPSTGRRASATDLMTWGSTLEQALDAYEVEEPPYDGVGFVFCSADAFVGIDLDKCRDPESGEIEPWAKKINRPPAGGLRRGLAVGDRHARRRRGQGARRRSEEGPRRDVQS